MTQPLIPLETVDVDVDDVGKMPEMRLSLHAMPNGNIRVVAASCGVRWREAFATAKAPVTIQWPVLVEALGQKAIVEFQIVLERA